MYISMKALRIIYAAIFVGIIYLNVSLSHNENIPDEVTRKIGTISFIALVALVIIGSSLGIVTSSE